MATMNEDIFRARFPKVHAWMLANPGFDFAQSLLAGVRKYGSLTERQMQAALKCMERDASRSTASPSARQIDVNVDALKQAFDRARNSGLHRIKLRVGEFDMSRAPDHGQNPGAIYVKHGATYLGKIVDNRLEPNRNFDDDLRARFSAIAADPLAAARMHGVDTGVCSCCGIVLTDPISKARGIGPICETRFFDAPPRTAKLRRKLRAEEVQQEVKL
jgi:hypothetical protein